MPDVQMNDGQVAPITPEPAAAPVVVEKTPIDAPKPADPVAPADPAAPVTAAAPVVEKPAEKTVDQLALMAADRVKARRAQRAANDARQTLSQREAQLRQREEQLAAEEKLVRENPLQWMGRKGVNGDELAKHLTDNPKPTEAERIAQLETRLAEKEAQETTQRQQWERQQLQRQIHTEKVAAADAFVEFLDANEKDFPECAQLLEPYIRAEYTQVMDTARAQNRTFTKKQVATYLDNVAKKFREDQNSRRASKRTAAPSEDATRPTANGAPGAARTADTRTLSSDLATTSGLPANLSQMSADERAEAYRQMYAKGAAR